MTYELDNIQNVLIKEMNNKLIYDDLINPTKLAINRKSEIEKLLIYTTIGKDKSYLKLLETFCESLCYTNVASKHLLVICDLSFHSDVYAILSHYAFLTFHIMDVEDTLTPEDASSNKLKIFNFKDIHLYNHCIYVDLDCCFLNNLDYLFLKPIQDGTLYAFSEFDDTIIFSFKNIIL
jgi:alpha-N-acetylglucosamine transferase